MRAPIDLFERDRQAAQEQAAASERARANNVRTFERMWLCLGVDCIRAANSSHQSEIAEALGIATNRWSRLLEMESQIQREEQELAGRPKKRPSEHGDELVPDRTLLERDRAWEEATKHRAESLAALKDLAKAERRELESFTKRR